MTAVIPTQPNEGLGGHWADVQVGLLRHGATGVARQPLSIRIMLSFDDKLWNELTGAYKTLFDPRPLLVNLETGQSGAMWPQLWDELYHQGDVGTASYASVPHFVRIYQKLGAINWNIYAMVAMIELARDQRGNPEVPKVLEGDYFRAFQDLAEIGRSEVLLAEETDAIRAVLAVIAIAKGLRTHGKFLVMYSEDELLEIDSRA